VSGILALLHRGRLASPTPGPDASEGASPPPRAFPHPELLERLTGVMAYRAPDGRGTWHEGPVGLGHALFRTHTPGEQAEPGVVHDPVAGLSLVADARLDHREELVRKLRAAGPHAARDAEGDLHAAASAPRLLLAAWRAWGPASPEHLLGDFAFVLWDAKARTLFAARDPFGVKPLFVAEPAGEAGGEGGGEAGWIVLSNTLPALLEHPGVPAEPDERALADHLLWGWVDHERRTHFAHIRQVPRGSWLRVTPGGLEERSYWQLPDPPELRPRQKGEVVEEFTLLLHEAVADRLPGADHAAVLQLSGGLDSGSIAAAAVAVRGGAHRLPAVTFGYGRLFADPEVPLSRVTAGALGLDHALFLADDWTEPLPGMARELPSWATPGDPAAAATAGWPLGPGFDQSDTFSPALAARGRVTLTGWDGDALLYGDARGHLAALARRGDLVRLGGELGALVREGMVHRRPPRTGLRGALRGTLRGVLQGRLRRGTGRAGPGPMEGYPEGWLHPDFEVRGEVRERWRASRDLAGAGAPGAGQAPHPRRATHRALNGAVWSPLFLGQDPGSTGQLLEARHPLMDLRLVRFFLSLPVVPWCVEKGILRAYLRPRLPPAIWRRRKQGLQGDPLVLTLQALAMQEDGPQDLARRLALEPRDPLVARRLLRSRWREAFLQHLRDETPDIMPPYWATRAHAMGRWLQALERRDALTTRESEARHEREGGNDDQDAEAVHPA
jgi:asparagine synthase (glutamine-hydrolysing)